MAQGFEFVNKIKGGVIPSGFIPAVEKGVVETMRHGVIAGYPVQGVRVTLFDGSYHSVDSSEMAFKVAGSMAFKQAMESAQACAAGADHDRGRGGPGGLRGRCDRRSELAPGAPAWNGAQGSGHRGQGRGADGGDAQLRARPAPDHRRTGDYSMELARYEEVPQHLAGQVVEKSQERREKRLRA